MSTKIYNAYRLIENVDLFQLRRDLLPLRDRLYVQELQKQVTDAVHTYDEAYARDRDVSLRKALSNRFKEYNGQQPTALAASEAVVFENPVRGERYMMLFGALASLDLDDILSLATVVEDFSYWDNTDEPEGFTRQSWQDRGKAWDEAIPERNAVNVQGVNIKLFSDYDAELSLHRLQQVVRRIEVPSFDDRCSRLGLSLYITDHVQQQGITGHEVVYAISRAMSEWAFDELPKTTKASFMARAMVVLQPVKMLDIVDACN